MAGKAFIPFLVGMMLLTGVCNTLLTKYQDLQCISNCDAPNPADRRHFEQPVWQTTQMFVGEMGCWLVLAASTLYKRLQSSSSRGDYAPLLANGGENGNGDEDDDDTAPVADPTAVKDNGRKPLTSWRVLLLALPAICDICGTTLMNVGLVFVAASIYQMTRGALVLFVGLFSVIFLKRHLPGFKWAALFVVVFGVAIVGLAGVIQQKPLPPPGYLSIALSETASEADGIALAAAGNFMKRTVFQVKADVKTPPVAPLRTLAGVLMIAGAQIFTASQFVLEESIMARYSTSALTVVGWEGTFGFLVTGLTQIIMHLAYGRTTAGRGSYFDARTGWTEITHNRAIAVSSLLIMLSIGGFNFFGLSVTRSVSATSRSTIDTCRTLFIWIVSLGLGWESFKWLQVLGFAALVYGTFLFNDIVRPPRFRRSRRADELLPERPIEHS